MRVLIWSGRILIFLFLFAFAIKNTESVNVRFIFDTFWQAPLIIVLLAFFIGGVVLGILSLLGTVFRLRREVSRLNQPSRDEQAKKKQDHALTASDDRQSL